MHDALECALGMKDVEPPLDWPGHRWRVGRRRTRLMGEFHTPLQAFARIRNHVLHARPLADTRAPTRPRAIWPPCPRHPRHTVRLAPHQDGLAMDADRIHTPHQYPSLTALLEEGQQVPSLAARLGHPASHRGPTRDRPVREHN